MNKSIIERYMEQVWNQKNTAIIKDLFAAEAKIHSPLGNYQSVQAMKETVEKWLKAIPDLQVSLLNTLEENDLVVSHWQAKGTHQHDFNEIAAKGNPVEYQGVTMYRMENGQVTEYWAYLDSWTLQSQMSV